MELYSSSENYKLYQGNMLDMLEVIEKESIDSIVCDPPYELNFMNKGWDNSGIAFNKDTWKQCYEVLKPGGYLLAFGGSRTYHRIACAIEDAGFEIRDTICWMYGMGFPKSMNIGKALEKRWNKNGENNRKQISEDRKALCEHEMRLLWERDIQKTKSDENQQNEVLQSSVQKQSLQSSINSTGDVWGEKSCLERWHNIQKTKRELQRCKVCEMSKRVFINGEERWICNGTQVSDGKILREMFEKSGSCASYRPQSEQQQDRKLNAIQEQCGTQESREIIEYWNKFGTALKPSFEPIIVARKPFKGSCVDNVIKYGVGGINIDECKIGNEKIYSLTKDLTATHGNNWGAGTPTPLTGEKVEHEGRFPANTILTYDETDFEEVCGGFPNTKSGKNGIRQSDGFNKNDYGKGIGIKAGMNNGEYGDSGSAARYFMNCKYTGKDEEIWKQLLVNNVENNLEILKATKDNIAQMNVEDLLKELKDHYAKYVENQQNLIEISIVQDIAKILTWDFKIETSQVIQDFILNYKKCTQFLKLVQFVEKMDNIDTTQTTQNLLKLFGYVKVVITNYIVGNFIVNELDQKRYTYQPKASKKDRDEGLDNFDVKGAKELLNREENSDGASWNGKYSSGNAYAGSGAPKKNTHPTVKPTELMQYLVRLVSPNGGTILDPFNGSGSTGKAVMYENKERNKNYKYIGIELTEEYLPIAKARIEYVCNLSVKKNNQLTILDFIGEDNE